MKVPPITLAEADSDPLRDLTRSAAACSAARGIARVSRAGVARTPAVAWDVTNSRSSGQRRPSWNSRRASPSRCVALDVAHRRRHDDPILEEVEVVLDVGVWYRVCGCSNLMQNVAEDRRSRGIPNLWRC